MDKNKLREEWENKWNGTRPTSDLDWRDEIFAFFLDNMQTREEIEKEFDKFYLEKNWMRLVTSEDLKKESEPILSFFLDKMFPKEEERCNCGALLSEHSSGSTGHCTGAERIGGSAGDSPKKKLPELLDVEDRRYIGNPYLRVSIDKINEIIDFLSTEE